MLQGFSKRFLNVAMSARESGSSAKRSSMVDWFQVTKSVSKRVPFPLIILLVLLATPSVYLFLKFPPLWRDSDGFYQVYAGNGEFTILHWPPLYCFLARIPIALGAIIRALAAGQAFPGFQILPPTFTDLGIFLLVFSQHVLLIATLFFASILLARSPLVRILIGGLFSVNPALYAFAHCVGSESLSNVLTLQVAVLGYKYVRDHTPSRILAFWFVAALVAAILTRHVNAVLIGLVPGTYLLAFAFTLSGLLKRMDGASTAKRGYLKLFVKSLVLGGISVLVAHLVVLDMCRIVKIPYRSRLGYTFEWRLFYLPNLSRESQEEVLERVDRNLDDPAVSFALSKGKNILFTRNSWDASVLHSALYEWLEDHGVSPWKRVHLEADRRLNRIALQFLLHGGWDFWRVVMYEFWTSLNYSPAEICRDAFRTTDILIRMSTEPAFAPVLHLSTLQPRRESYESEWARDPYLTFGQAIPIWAMILAVLVGACCLTLFRPEHVPEISLYAVSLVVTGIVVSISNCALTFLLPRFTLTLYILTLFGLAMLLARLSEGFTKEHFSA